MCSCSFSAGGHLSCLVFSELLESLVWRHSLSEDLPTPFSLPHPFAFPMNTFKYLLIIPQFLATLLFFFQSLFLCFSDFQVCMSQSGVQGSLPQQVQGTVSHGHPSILLEYFMSCICSLGFSLRMPISPSIKTFRILIIISRLLHNSNLPATSLVLMLVQFLQPAHFAFKPVTVFLLQLDVMHLVKGSW